MASNNPYAPVLHERILRGLETQNDEAVARALARSEGVLPPDGAVLRAIETGSDGSDGDGGVEADAWTTQISKKTRRRGRDGNGSGGGRGVDDVAAAPGVGLGNRYGENNCYLNVVVQSLYRLQAFRQRFEAEYAAVYRGLQHSPVVQGLKQARVATQLLASLHELFASMDATSRAVEAFQASLALTGGPVAATPKAATVSGAKVAQPGGDWDAAISLNSLKKCLHDALVEREASKATPPGPKGGGRVGGLSSKAAAAALVRTIATHAMGDASEAMEEIVTLCHDAETVLRTLAKCTTAAGALSALEAMRGRTEADALAGEAAPQMVLPVAPHHRTTAALAAFGQLHTGVAVCAAPACGACTPSTVSTCLALHVNTYALLHARATALRQHASQPFGHLLRLVLEEDDARPCRACGGGMRCHRALVRQTGVVTVTLGWLSAREPADTVRAVLESVDAYVDLFDVFHQDGPAGVAAKMLSGLEPPAGSPLPARLRGIVCYKDNHWVAFFDVAPAGKPASWICCNDERVFRVEFPLAQAIAYQLQPSMLFYDTLMIGDALPSDRGRAALHGHGDPLVHIPLSIAISAGAAGVALTSDTAFPSLPPSKGPSKPAGGAWGKKAASASAPAPAVSATDASSDSTAPDGAAVSEGTAFLVADGPAVDAIAGLPLPSCDVDASPPAAAPAAVSAPAAAPAKLNWAAKASAPPRPVAIGPSSASASFSTTVAAAAASATATAASAPTAGAACPAPAASAGASTTARSMADANAVASMLQHLHVSASAPPAAATVRAAAPVPHPGSSAAVRAAAQQPSRAAIPPASVGGSARKPTTATASVQAGERPPRGGAGAGGGGGGRSDLDRGGGRGSGRAGSTAMPPASAPEPVVDADGFTLVQSRPQRVAGGGADDFHGGQQGRRGDGRGGGRGGGEPRGGSGRGRGH